MPAPSLLAVVLLYYWGGSHLLSQPLIQDVLCFLSEKGHTTQIGTPISSLIIPCLDFASGDFK